MKERNLKLGIAEVGTKSKEKIRNIEIKGEVRILRDRYHNCSGNHRGMRILKEKLQNVAIAEAVRIFKKIYQKYGARRGRENIETDKSEKGNHGGRRDIQTEISKKKRS